MSSLMSFSANQSRTVSLINQKVVGEEHFTLDVLIYGSATLSSENFWISDEQMALLSTYALKPEIFLHLIALIMSEDADEDMRMSFEWYLNHGEYYALDVNAGDSKNVSYSKDLAESVLDTLYEGEDSTFATEILPGLEG